MANVSGVGQKRKSSVEPAAPRTRLCRSIHVRLDGVGIIKHTYTLHETLLYDVDRDASTDYKPVELLCCNENPTCVERLHSHFIDRLYRGYLNKQKNFTFAQAHCEYPQMVEPLAEYAQRVPVDELRYNCLPQFVKDLFSSLLYYAENFRRLYPLCVRDMRYVQQTERRIRELYADNDPEAMAERLAANNTTKQQVVRTFTDSKDIVMRKYAEAVRFTCERLVQGRVLEFSATATVPLCMEKIFKTFIADLNEPQALADLCEVLYDHVVLDDSKQHLVKALNTPLNKAKT